MECRNFVNSGLRLSIIAGNLISVHHLETSRIKCIYHDNLIRISIGLFGKNAKNVL